MSNLIIKDLRHHGRQWAWSLMVSIAGGTFIGVIIVSWWSALDWAQQQPNSASLTVAANLIGSNLTSYAGLAIAAILASCLALTVAAQQRAHALWKILGIPGERIRRIVQLQAAILGLVGGLAGSLLCIPVARLYLLSWQEFDLFPATMPMVMPAFGVPLTAVITAGFCMLGARGSARRAAATPEMQALRESSTPRSKTSTWQWVVCSFLLFGAIAAPLSGLVEQLEQPSADMSQEDLAVMREMQTPGGRAMMGGSVGLMLMLAALCVPNWTIRPLLRAWTRLGPLGNPAFFAARANAVHRSAMSMTTIVPFALAVGMTGTIYATVGASQSQGVQGAVSGFMAVAVPIFLVAATGGVANIAMVGRARSQEGALLEVIGARRSTVVASTVWEGAIYALTGIIFGLLATLISATYAAALSGGGLTVFRASIPFTTLLPVVVVSLVLAVATTWLPAQLDRRATMDNLRQPV